MEIDNSTSITPSDIIQYLYCPRFTYYEKVLCIPQYEQKSYKAMLGRTLHEHKAKVNKEYLRKRFGVTGKYQEQYLTNSRLRGVIDEVLVLGDDTMAPLDYKFAQYKDRVFNTYKTQLYCYSWLIEENFGKPVTRGFIVYTRSKNKVIELPVKPEDVVEVKKAAYSIIEIIETNRYPKATNYKKRCLDCTYRNICIK